MSQIDSLDSSSIPAKVQIGANGRIVIPAVIRERLGLKPGDTVLMDVEDCALRIESYPARIARIQRAFAHLRNPAQLASDQLIAERREEVRREEEQEAEFQRRQELIGAKAKIEARIA
jgi:AbrB family looped-hinge helix DNA binding protein